jgi:hypothetical protein
MIACYRRIGQMLGHCAVGGNVVCKECQQPGEPSCQFSLQRSTTVPEVTKVIEIISKLLNVLFTPRRQPCGIRAELRPGGITAMTSTSVLCSSSGAQDLLDLLVRTAIVQMHARVLRSITSHFNHSKTSPALPLPATQRFPLLYHKLTCQQPC